MVSQEHKLSLADFRTGATLGCCASLSTREVRQSHFHINHSFSQSELEKRKHFFLLLMAPKRKQAKEKKDTKTIEVPIDYEVNGNLGEKDSQSSTEHSHHARHKIAQSKVKLERKLYQTRRATFVLGALLGLVVAVFITAYNSDNLMSEIDKLVNLDGVNGFFDEWKDVIPVKFDAMNGFLDEWKDSLPLGFFSLLDQGKSDSNELHGSAESFSVGRRMKKQYNMTAKYNVVLVPGVISTGIESWGTSETGDCPSINHFRKRLWGSFYMLRTMILDKTCWLRHILLDPETGLDPPGIKLRAAQGFEAADFFVAGYWIWNKILQNLSVIGYNPNNMLSASYDWRLAYLDLERRDGYFSKLKQQIELAKKMSGQKTYLIGHSMGSQVILYFMKWVEASGEYYGNGGKNWCNEHLAGIIDISGSLLGTPKTIPALISGEMKDTVQLNQLAIYGLEKFFSRKERVDMLRTFGGVPSMLPRGGDFIWGNLTYAPDDPPNELSKQNEDVDLPRKKNESLGTFVRYRAKNLQPNTDGLMTQAMQNLTITSSIDYILSNSPKWFTERVKEHYSFGIAKTKKELQANDKLHSKWSNPLEVALPNAPDMKIFCFYGVGNPTERAYTYTDGDKESGLPLVIDLDSDDPVFLADGDGTVSLLTHYICHEWQKPGSIYNPGGIETKIVEIKHEPDRFDIRGGAKTAEHVDILGSAELNELILRVVSGNEDTINNTYVSDLRNIVQRMQG